MLVGKEGVDLTGPLPLWQVLRILITAQRLSTVIRWRQSLLLLTFVVPYMRHPCKK